jgi:hypothetical protein
MGSYNNTLKKAYGLFTEQGEDSNQTPDQIPQTSALPGSTGGNDLGGGSMPPGINPGESDQPNQKLDDKEASELDPSERIKSIMDALTKISPQDFNDYIDNYSKNLDSDARDEFKSAWHAFATRIKKLYRILQSGAFNMLDNNQSDPDGAKGGTNGAGPSGPGV